MSEKKFYINHKWLENFPQQDHLLNLTDKFENLIQSFDFLYEEYKLFCHGRWFGAQILQDPMDMMYIQEIITTIKPGLIISTGTYMGGLEFFMSTLLGRFF